MTFDLNRLAYASPSTSIEADEKRLADLPKDCIFTFNCLAQFLGQQLQTPGKIRKNVFERLYQIYHDEFYAKESSYSDECRKKFCNEISKLNPLETELQLTRIFVKLLQKEGKLKEFARNPQQNMVDFIASLGIKLEHWGYVDALEGLQKQAFPLSMPGLMLPELPEDSPTLKLLFREQRIAREGLSPIIYWQEHGFEYDWLGEQAELQARTLKQLQSQRLHFRREQARFEPLRARSAESSPTSNDAAGKPDSASPFETLLAGVFKSLGLGAGKLRDERTGSLTLQGLFTLMITGITQIFAMFSNFMNQADQAYKNNNPGRPLEADEIKDQQDELFNKYIGQLSKEHETIRERLTRSWRLAKTSEAKNQGIEALKEALLETGNLQVFDKLRFEGYLGKIKNPAARDFFRRQKLDKTRGWNLLQQHLMREESYLEVDEILQEKALGQLQALSENPEFQNCDVVEAYQQAFEKLNLQATSLASRLKNDQKNHCQIRQSILNFMAYADHELKKFNHTLKEMEKAKKEVQERFAADTKQHQERLAAISAKASDVKDQQEKLEAEYNAKKLAAEKIIAEQQTHIQQLNNAKAGYKQQIAEKLRGDLDKFIPSKSERAGSETESAEVKAKSEASSRLSLTAEGCPVRPFVMSSSAKAAASGVSRSAASMSDDARRIIPAATEGFASYDPRPKPAAIT